MPDAAISHSTTHSASSTATATWTSAAAVTPRNAVAATATEAGSEHVVSADVNFAVNLQLWANISDILWWKVIVISAVSIIILCQTLMLMRRYRKSNYFHFLVFMIILHLIMLISIIFNLVSERAFAYKGDMTCRVTAFVTNVTSCYINWLWVMMFVQRFIHVFYPMHRIKADDGGTMFRIIDDTRQVILLTGLMAVAAQLWTPFLMKEVLVYDDISEELKGSYCGPDATIINPNLYKYITVVESLWTYGIPCLITVFADVAVLWFRHDSKRFTTVCAEEITSGKKHCTSRQTSSSARHADDNTADAYATNGTFRAVATCHQISTEKNEPASESRRASDQALVQSNGNLELDVAGSRPLLQDGPPPKPPRAGQHALPPPISPSLDIIRADTIGSAQRSRTWTRHPVMANGGLIGALNASRTARTKSITVPIKIQSEDSLRACHRRRQRAIRRCLLMATMQLLLNLPNYMLQLVDEFSGWRRTSRRFAEFYLYADALFYLLYLSQYPMMAVYVRWLHGNFAAPTSSAYNVSTASSACTGGVLRSSSRLNLFGRDGSVNVNSHHHGAGSSDHSNSVTTSSFTTMTAESKRRRLSAHLSRYTTGNDDGSLQNAPTASASRLSVERPADGCGGTTSIVIPAVGCSPQKRHSTGGTLFHSEHRCRS